MIYEVWLPAAIRYGIPYEVFWKLNPKIMEIYQKQYLDSLNYDNMRDWRAGMYIHDAIEVGLSHLSPNSKAKYPEEPYRILPETEEEKKARAEKERQRAIAFFTSMADSF